MEAEARLENWHYSAPYGVLYGDIYDDKAKRFIDGFPVRTSAIRNRWVDMVEGALIQTINTLYVLGKPA